MNRQQFERQTRKASNGPAHRKPYYIYRTEVWTKEDDALREVCNEMLSNFLLATLFSAVVAPFLLASVVLLQPDWEAAALEVLLQISTQLPATPSPDNATANYSSAAVWSSDFCMPLVINILWSIALVVSLVTVVFSMLVTRWLLAYKQKREALHVDDRNGRRELSQSLRRWGVHSIVTLLPVCLHLAVGLFLVGLALFTWTVKAVLGITITGLTSSAALLYVTVAMLPYIYPECPYGAPVPRIEVQLSNQDLKSFFYGGSGPMVETSTWNNLRAWAIAFTRSRHASGTTTPSLPNDLENNLGGRARVMAPTITTKNAGHGIAASSTTISVEKADMGERTATSAPNAVFLRPINTATTNSRLSADYELDLGRRTTEDDAKNKPELQFVLDLSTDTWPLPEDVAVTLVGWRVPEGIRPEPAKKLYGQLSTRFVSSIKALLYRIVEPDDDPSSPTCLGLFSRLAAISSVPDMRMDMYEVYDGHRSQLRQWIDESSDHQLSPVQRVLVCAFLLFAAGDPHGQAESATSMTVSSETAWRLLTSTLDNRENAKLSLLGSCLLFEYWDRYGLQPGVVLDELAGFIQQAAHLPDEWMASFLPLLQTTQSPENADDRNRLEKRLCRRFRWNEDPRDQLLQIIRTAQRQPLRQDGTTTSVFNSILLYTARNPKFLSRDGKKDSMLAALRQLAAKMPEDEQTRGSKVTTDDSYTMDPSRLLWRVVNTIADVDYGRTAPRPPKKTQSADQEFIQTLQHLAKEWQTKRPHSANDN
ncbi:hypothetical protein CALCODRAFT_80471 [Calocera cornea HHB12733]|uniref:DUF6535 domain-containing protein n=1 Tax=Calocera cornea HHB12733 TaxID=1353952 RepID=A0A165DF42_9BASI|nr:hypothetical protein CALCODRAFT_80471 [Calocera cornea HHB12733]